MKFDLKKVLLAATAVVIFGLTASVSAQTVGGSIAGGSVTKGKAARATVTLSLPAGLHANSNRPGSEYAIPTTVRASATGAKIGPIRYPPGRNRKFEFSETTLNVYEGRPSFSFNVTVPSTYKASTIKVNVVVKYQACTNEVCYPPKSKEITLTAKVI